jgi:hypothetical protein
MAGRRQQQHRGGGGGISLEDHHGTAEAQPNRRTPVTYTPNNNNQRLQNQNCVHKSQH